MSSPHVTSADIGKRIRERREYLGLTQNDIAQAMGWTRPNVTNIEDGQPITAEKLGLVAKILRVSIAYFYGEGEDADEGEAQLITDYRALPAPLRPAAVAVVAAIRESAPK